MDEKQAKQLLADTFQNAFDKSRFLKFLRETLKHFDETQIFYDENEISEQFRNYVASYELLGKYTFESTEIHLMTVYLKKDTSVHRARRAQRDFVAWHLNNYMADAAIVAFVSPGSEVWRFSLVKMDYKIEETAAGKVKVKEEFTPSKRWSFLVGENEKSHTLQSRFLEIIKDDSKMPSLEDLQNAFNVEKVTEEFFDAYRYALREVIVKSLDKYDQPYTKKYSFAQQLLSRILFIYFVQRKGWLKWKDYVQDKYYLKNLWLRYKENYKQYGTNRFYSVWLKSLFFGAFNRRSHLISKELPEEIQESFRNMPYLNGGLFAENELDELGFDIPDSVFEWLFEPDENSNDKRKGFLEIFNFTIDESLPVDIEVAVDPEMLGKVYESLISDDERGSSGVFYTPRFEIDFMSRLSLVHYLHAETGIDKKELIDLVFNHGYISMYDNEENLRKVKKALDKVKIVDPAAGSGSFLVGMLNVLVELHSALTERLERREENLFALKRKIILENLYGVDVKDWAVMVAELRLWLSLIIETEEKEMDIYTSPLLPNLSFKIRQGDSLVEEIGGIFISLRGAAVTAPSLNEKIRELIDRKTEFFSGHISANLKEYGEIEQFEIGVFKEILTNRMESLKEKKAEKERELKELEANVRNLFGQEDKSVKEKQREVRKEISELEEEIDKLQKALEGVSRKTKKDYFLWEIDFAEVFAVNGGFDIVIGNPPYVRQELIAPPLEEQDNYADDKWLELKKGYKEKLIKAVQTVWPSVQKVDKKSDLYVYFYYQGLSLLKDGGIFCFINSNSWLDVKYGTGLQEFLIKKMKPLYIIDSVAKRSFAQADVNTIIVLIQKPKGKVDDFVLKFVAFKKPFEEAVTAKVLNDIEEASKPVFDNPVYRVVPKAKRELLEEGVEFPEEEEKLSLGHTIESLPYIGNKWGGKYLRAPEIYFKILEKGKGKLVRLGDIAEVRFGIKTGANEFFYLKPVGMTVKDVVEIAQKDPQALIRVRNGAGWEGEIEAEFLKPVFKSPKESRTIMVGLDKVNYLVFLCDKSLDEISSKAAKNYIIYGERQGYNNKRTCKGRKHWWLLPKIESNVFMQMTFDDTFIFWYSPDKIACDARLYTISVDKVGAYLLNSSLSFLFIEMLGRANLGDGALDFKVYEARNIMLLDPSLVDVTKIKFPIFNRIINSVFLEFGFSETKMIHEQEPAPLPDRKELDNIVFDALRLTEEERKEVYWAVAELVKARLDKAGSV